MKQLESAAQRYAVYAEQVLAPAVFSLTAQLRIGARRYDEPIPHAEALGAEYEPVEIGWRWGPAWSTAWFHITGQVPAEWAGKCVALRFSSATEALLWEGGVARQGFDPNRDAHVLFDAAVGGEKVDLHIEAACNHPFGTTSFVNVDSDEYRRWSGATPGRLDRCELTVYHANVWRLWRTYEFARQAMLLFTDDDLRGQMLDQALRRATQCLDAANVAGTAGAVLAILEAALSTDTVSRRSHCFAVGHAHIDTAWLWPLRESRRKCQRSFANVLGLMGRFPDFRFLCSQAQQYAWIEESTPELFARIAERVREGRWEPGGGMWVECDCNTVSGESLARQILHGTRYWETRFGDHGRQQFVYLPDTFGFSAALPQIMALAGLDVFITNKLSWNDTNEFPLTNFRWRGIDGTEVLAHCTPGHDYNASNTPADLHRGDQNIARKDNADTGVWLHPFGFGDGGGGPTDWQILNAVNARKCDGLPDVRLAGTRTFCEALRQERKNLQTQGRDLPIWDGELYLEYHRGTYTTQSWLKRANRLAEHGLGVAECLSFAGPVRAEDGPVLMPRLDRAWKLLLLNQFHDILPGSSIGWVYDEAREHHDEIRETCGALTDAGLQRWAAAVDTTGLRRPLMVFNPTSHVQAGVVEHDGDLHYVAQVPPMGVRVVDATEPPGVAPATAGNMTLSNGVLEATIDEQGRVARLKRFDSDREVGAPRPDGTRSPLNQLVLYEDRPRAWDAWEIDREYVEKPRLADAPAESCRVVEKGPLRAAIEIVRPLGQGSRLTQRFVLAAGSPRLDIQTHIEWHERQCLLRALFPVDVRSRRATYEIQYGHIERATHRNTSWEQAQFEVCAHRWVDLSEPGFGVALLNDGKYGHSCRDNVMGLTLLRSPRFPDHNADRGTHEFTYSLMPHDGDWRGAGVLHEAEALNTPLLMCSPAADQPGACHDGWAPIEIAVAGAADVVIAAFKRAEDDERLILRLVESHGARGTVTLRWHLPVSAVETVDLLERPLAVAGFVHHPADKQTVISIRPFQIITLAATRA